jgi:hypothetical protein
VYFEIDVKKQYKTITFWTDSTVPWSAEPRRWSPVYLLCVTIVCDMACLIKYDVSMTEWNSGQVQKKFWVPYCSPDRTREWLLVLDSLTRANGVYRVYVRGFPFLAGLVGPVQENIFLTGHFFSRFFPFAQQAGRQLCRATH